MICGVCGGSGRVLRSPIVGRFRDWFRRCPGLCEGTGVVSNAMLHANPRPNQLDWFGAYFRRAALYFSGEVPAYPDRWFRPLARCAVWDSRDWYEFSPS